MGPILNDVFVTDLSGGGGGVKEQGRRTSVSVEKDYNQLQATLAMREKELVKAKRELEV